MMSFLVFLFFRKIDHSESMNIKLSSLMITELAYLNFLAEVELLQAQEIVLRNEFVSLSQQMKICLERNLRPKEIGQSIGFSKVNRHTRG